MPELNSIETIYLVVAFLVPGLIASFIRAQFITGRMPSHTEAALSYLTLSIVYYALVFPLVEYTPSIEPPAYGKIAAWFLLVFIGPSLFGLALGLWAQKEVGRRLLRRLQLNPVHAMPTAWDWKLSNTTEAWVLVVLKDDTRFAGLYGSGSFASSDPEERDLYIEKVYEIDNKNFWHPRDNGVLIGSDEIRTIEFWPYREEIDHG